MKNKLQSGVDHLVITAPNLPKGLAFAERYLGVSLEPGGSHPGMGTHNALLKLGETCYLEVIAIEPGAECLFPHRWFELDALSTGDEPRLRTWVSHTNQMQEAIALAPAWFERAIPMSRGNLAWWVTLPPAGKMPLGGICPSLIQWPAGVHPCQRLKDQGCRLVKLEIYHPEMEGLSHFLKKIGFESTVEWNLVAQNEAGFFRAIIQCPRGLVVLDSRGDLTNE